MTVQNSSFNALQNFSRDVLLRDGAVLRMRALQRTDREALIALFHRCSPETRRYRFLRMITSLPNSLLDDLVAVDGVHHVALVVTRGEEREELIVAVGRYVADDAERPSVAEVSFLVEDSMQRRGLGTILLDTLAEIARTHQITRFTADVLADNRLMLSVFRKAGYALSSNISYGVTQVEFPILRSEIAEARREAQEAEAERASLAAIFAPKVVAVIGAGRDPASVGGALFRNLLRWDYTGTLYPVNPAATSIAGVRAYAGIADLPETPELAFISVPAAHVLEVARHCAAVKVRALCVISAGFAETGEEGRAAQVELLKICRASGMRLIGPNCMGLVNTAAGVRLLGTFVPVQPPGGNLAMSSQSGALGLALMAQAGQLDLGISSFISTGNKADVSGNDLLQYWESDEATDVILLYLESFGNPRRFARIARRVSRAKPIVAVKSGRTAAGARAASSHTAALANSDRAVEALFAQTGIIRVDTLAQFFSTARLLASQPLPQGKRLGILTNGGGPGIIAVDAAVAAGLEVSGLSEAVQQRLREVLPRAASVNNPIDIIANSGPREYRACLEILCDAGELDALMVIFIPPLATPTREVAQVLSEVLAERPNLRIPIAAVFFDPHSNVVSIPIGDPEEGRPKRSVPVYTFPEGAAAALGAAARYGTWRAAPPGNLAEVPIDREAIDRVLAAGSEGWLSQAAVASLLGAAGIEILAPRTVRSAAEAQRAAEAIDAPVAIKVQEPAVLHKADVGGVILNVAPAEAAKAYRQLEAQLQAHHIRLSAASVMPMVKPGVEVLAGVTHDPVFGPLVAFGSGGYLVELFDDVVFRVLPLTDRDVSEMIRSTRAYHLLQGYRGSPAADLAAVERLLSQLGALAEAVPQIAEVDLNPVIVHPQGEGISLIDTRIRLAAV
ncbi:MAG TPA: GNAT family N-acetyltransferase [Blastocatellia bacterium]|nr:GNAT family N-acetyltransferase [Blastocatellia bacterium]